MAGYIFAPLQRLSRSPNVGGPVGGHIATPIMRRDMQDGGHGYIAGTVTINGVPASRRVRLFDLISGRLIRETWSASNGAYQFDYLALNREYLVLSHDYQAIYNAVVADRVTAEAMP